MNGYLCFAVCFLGFFSLLVIESVSKDLIKEFKMERIIVTEEELEAFHRLLEDPARDLPALKKLLNTKSPWEKEDEK